MQDLTASVIPSATVIVVPPPRRRRTVLTLGIHGVHLITMLGLLPLAASIIGFALLSHRRLPTHTRPRGRPKTYSDASILLLALVGRLWGTFRPVKSAIG